MAHYYEAVVAEVATLSDREAVERYALGAGPPGEAIRGLNREQLLSHPVPGTWSIQQIVLHLMDTDLIASSFARRQRLRRSMATQSASVGRPDVKRIWKRIRTLGECGRLSVCCGAISVEVR